MSSRKLSKAKKGWDAAIQTAREQIQKLETSIKVFEKNKAAGEPWPGMQSVGQTSEPCHSV